MSRLGQYFLPQRGHVAPGASVTLVVTPAADMLVNVLLIQPDADAFDGLVVESVKVGPHEILAVEVPASVFSLESVYPSPAAAIVPQGADEGVKAILLALWDAFQGRRHEPEDDEDGEDDAPPGMTLGNVVVRANESVCVVLRSARPVDVSLVFVGLANLDEGA